MLLVALLAIALAYFALLDGWYLVRVPCAVLRARLLLPRVRDLLAEQRYANRVLPSDLDLLLHMNNARYLREADVAYVSHQARCGVLGALPALGASAVLGASCVRYRRSLRLLEPFEVRTRLLGWDDRAFYLEARFISLRDGFVCALLRARHHVLGTSPERVVQHLCKRRVSAPAPGAPPSPGEGPLPWGAPAPPHTAPALSFGSRAPIADAVPGSSWGPRSTRRTWALRALLLPLLTLAPQGSTPRSCFPDMEAQTSPLPGVQVLCVLALLSHPLWSLVLNILCMDRG